MAKPNVWGNEFTLKMIGQVFNLKINLIQENEKGHKITHIYFPEGEGEIKLTRGDNLCGGSRGRTRGLRKLDSLRRGRDRRVAVWARWRPGRLDRAVIL